MSDQRLRQRRDMGLLRPGRSLIAVQQFIPNLAIVDLCHAGFQTVDLATFGIDADIRLRAETSVDALLRRQHLHRAPVAVFEV